MRRSRITLSRQRLDPNGIKVLQSVSMPNFTNTAITGGNVQLPVTREITKKPKYTEVVKVDYNLTTNDRLTYA